VLRAMLRNALAQVSLTRIGDTLGNEHLALSARRPIETFFPARELAAFDAGAQMRGALGAMAAPLASAHVLVLALSAIAAPLLLWRALRASDTPRAAMLAGALLALLVNAAATGALSKPHHRYQARIAWVLPLVAMLAVSHSTAAERLSRMGKYPRGARP
jgi:hypothetical protein